MQKSAEYQAAADRDKKEADKQVSIAGHALANFAASVWHASAHQFQHDFAVVGEVSVAAVNGFVRAAEATGEWSEQQKVKRHEFFKQMFESCDAKSDANTTKRDVKKQNSNCADSFLPGLILF